ncbi:MAG: glycosyltransferase [Acidobacteriota bacterium]
MPAPEVSVLMPVRDAAPTLRSALRSLERQTLRNFEIVTVDDGSCDGSAELLEAWSRRDSRLRLLRRPAEGLVPALEAGRRACRAPLIARMDADDAALPRRLELQTRALAARPDLAGVACRIRCFPRARIAGGFRAYEAWLNSLLEPEEIVRERFIESPLVHPSVTVRRAVLESVGGYREAGWAEDYDLWLRLMQRGERFAKLPQILHLWRDHAGRETRVNPRYGKREFLAAKAHFLARGPLAEADRLILWGAGPTGRGLAKALRAEGLVADAFVDIDAKKVGRSPGGVPVYGLAELPRLWREGTRVVIAVARRGARESIRPHLARWGLKEGEDAWFAA